LILRIGGPFGSGFMFEARTVKATTTAEMKKVPPTMIAVLFTPSGFSSPTAAIDENTSGAPFPSAKSVTPASDSGNLNVVVIVSRAGDKKASAVSDKIYIKIAVKSTPTGMKAGILPFRPKDLSKPQ